MSQLGRPNRVQRPFKSHETCLQHPCGQAGQPKASRLRHRHDNIKALAGRPSSCHPACLLFTITSEQDNGGHKHAPLQTLSLISECYQGKFRPYQPGDWWSQTGSNRRPQACKASALPTELWPRPSGLWSSLKLVGLSGLEPLTSRLSGVCSNHLSYRPLRDPRGSL